MFDSSPIAPTPQSLMPTARRYDAPLKHINGNSRGIRVALYSHDTMGLGHLRRNLLIAEALSGSSLNASCLLITGAHEANFFRLPEKADCLTLPRWRKDIVGEYKAGHLDLEADDLVRLRSESIRSALEVFAPQVLIVDKVPAGAFGEMLPTLRSLAKKSGTRIVLGLRDVLDDPQTVAQEWLQDQNVPTIDRFYDAIWVYGDRKVYDTVEEYSLPPSIASKIVYTGFIDQTKREVDDRERTLKVLDDFPAGLPLVACSVGGGQDGAQLAHTFVEAFPREGCAGILIGGPFMPSEHLQALHQAASHKKNLKVLDFVPEADLLIEQADRVVAMGGYNTVCSVLSFGKHALIIPRTHPRREQEIRAKNLADLSMLDTISPEDLTVQNLRDWILAEAPVRTAPCETIDLTGLDTIARLTQQLVASPSRLDTRSSVATTESR